MKNSTSSCTEPPPTHQDCTVQPKSTRKTTQLDLLSTDSLGYETSRALADLLNLLIGNTKHHVKKSKNLAEELSGVFIEEKEIFNSHDIASLFTDTPIKESLDIIKKRLIEDKDLKKRTKLGVDNIIELLEFILTTTYFEFRGTIYRQRFGATMAAQ